MRLLDAMAKCLAAITVQNGFRTDAGLAWTLEPTPADGTADAVLTAVIDKQQRAVDPALSKTHRLTTVSVMAKVPAALGSGQTQLDAMVSDIEEAMANQQHQYPRGISFPIYVSMEPLMPESAGAGWVGVAVTYQSNTPNK